MWIAEFRMTFDHILVSSSKLFNMGDLAIEREARFRAAHPEKFNLDYIESFIKKATEEMEKDLKFGNVQIYFAKQWESTDDHDWENLDETMES